MTEILNASIAAGATSADLAVSALEPHGINTTVPCQAFSKNATTGTLHPLGDAAMIGAIIIYPTTATLVIKNNGSSAGVVQVTAK